MTERKHAPQAKYGAERNTRSALNYFPPHGALAPFCALALPAAGLCVGFGRRAPAPRFPCRPPRAPLRSLLPPAACRFAPAPRWSVLLNCGGARRACGAGRPRRALAFARPAPRRAGKFFPPLPARLVPWVGLRPVPSPSLRSASALPLARPRSPVVRLAAVPYYTRSRCGARVTRAGFRPPVAPFRSARFGHLWRRRRRCAASVFLFHLIIQKQLAVNQKNVA